MSRWIQNTRLPTDVTPVFLAFRQTRRLRGSLFKYMEKKKLPEMNLTYSVTSSFPMNTHLEVGIAFCFQMQRSNCKILLLFFPLSQFPFCKIIIFICILTDFKKEQVINFVKDFFLILCPTIIYTRMHRFLP